jgi:hypothetical protein
MSMYMKGEIISLINFKNKDKNNNKLINYLLYHRY